MVFDAANANYLPRQIYTPANDLPSLRCGAGRVRLRFWWLLHPTPKIEKRADQTADDPRGSFRGTRLCANSARASAPQEARGYWAETLRHSTRLT